MKEHQTGTKRASGRNIETAEISLYARSLRFVLSRTQTDLADIASVVPARLHMDK